MLFLITCDEDGDIRVQEVSEQDVLELAADGRPQFFEAQPPTADPNYWGGKALLIEGRIVTVKPKETEIVRSYEIG